MQNSPETHDSSETHGTTVRILLAEDEALVRRLVSRTLREAGFEVAEAEDGASALELLVGESSEIHAIVTDVVMPGLSGPEFVKRGQEELERQVPVLYVSGYLSYPTGRAAPLPEGATLLKKPFTATQLLDELDRVLRERYPGFSRDGAPILSFSQRTGA